MQKKRVRKTRNHVKARFYSVILSILIIVTIGYFFWQAMNTQIPNLHGWESTKVLDFGKEHDIEINFEFIYSNDMAPTRVLSQSVPPGTAITEGMSFTVEISKGVEVR